MPGFNFFIPAKYVRELMSRNNVDNKQDPIMDLYEEGLRLYYNKHYSAAIEKFQLVKNLNPGFPYVDEYIANAQAAILRGEDVPLESGFNPMMIFVIVGAAVAGVGAAAFIFLRKKAKETRVSAPYQYPVQPVPAQTPVQPQPMQQVEQEPLASTSFKYCWNCGRRIPGDARICPYCGVEQEE